MENASKALIIAGSILLSILIIALGMYIFSTSSSTSDVGVLNETEIQTFNAKFEKYKGDNQLGSNVDALITALRSNATANKGAQEKVPTVIPTNITGAKKATGQIDISGNVSGYIDNLTTISDNLEKSHRYDVTMTYSEEGLIDTITIAY